MTIPYYSELDKKNRGLKIKLIKTNNIHNISIPNDNWVYEKNDENSNHSIWGSQDDEIPSQIILPGQENNPSHSCIIPFEQLSKLDPITRREVIEILRNEIRKEQIENLYDREIFAEVITSFLSPIGELIDNTSTHKNNNFIYQYDDGIDLINDMYGTQTIKKITMPPRRSIIETTKPEQLEKNSIITLYINLSIN